MLIILKDMILKNYGVLGVWEGESLMVGIFDREKSPRGVTLISCENLVVLC